MRYRMITPTIPTQPRQMSSVISVCVLLFVCVSFFGVCVYLDSRFILRVGVFLCVFFWIQDLLDSRWWL